jgi:hypothetical protein
VHAHHPKCNRLKYNNISNLSRYLLISLCISLSLSFSLRAQVKDTILDMVLSKPYFYNLVKSENSQVFVGTAEGIFELTGTKMRQYDRNPGYIKTDKKGIPVIDHNGVRYYSEKKYSHLIPFPDYGGYEYHASQGNHFYVCSGGRLYIFDLLAYEYSYPNHSIRSISRDFVSTYSGIYYRGKRLGPPVPPFSDGYVRQYGDRAFICDYDMMVIEKDGLETGKITEGVNALFYGMHNDWYLINDVSPLPDSSGYYVATQDKLMITNRTFTKDSVLFVMKGKNGPVGLLASGNSYSLIYYADNALYALKTGLLTRLDTTILSVGIIGHQLYLVTPNGLYRFNSNQKLEKLADIYKAHTLETISESELAIGTDQGLYYYNIASGELSLIIKSVEFNRRALFKDNGKIHAGSVNGLYTIQISDIPKLVEENKFREQDKSLSFTQYTLITLSVLVFLLLMFWLFRLSRKLKQSESIVETLQATQEIVTKEQIEKFIVDNLAVSSIKSITDHFKLSTQQLYELVKPEKPGSIIQKHRMEMVRKMRQEQKPVKEIAAATGLSVSYIRQLKTDDAG